MLSFFRNGALEMCPMFLLDIRLSHVTQSGSGPFSGEKLNIRGWRGVIQSGLTILRSPGVASYTVPHNSTAFLGV